MLDFFLFRVIAARLNGSIDFLELEFSSQADIPKPQSTNKPSRAQKRGKLAKG